MVDRRTAVLGIAYSRAIRRAQTAVWAGVAEAEYEARRLDLRRQNLVSSSTRERSAVSRRGWQQIPKSRQKQYLAGTRRPQKHVIDDVAEHAPGSDKAFRSVLWQVLSPQTDLQTCMVIVSMFDERKLETFVSDLLLGHPHNVVEHLADLNSTGALVAHIRLLVHRKEPDRAFDEGCALAQALCYHAVNPLFASGAPLLWDLISQGVFVALELCKDKLKFSRCRDGFRHFSKALWERLVSAQALYGVRRLALGASFKWETIVDMNHECIRGFATPELDRPDILQSFLDVGSPNARISSQLDKDPLFLLRKPSF